MAKGEFIEKVGAGIVNSQNEDYFKSLAEDLDNSRNQMLTFLNDEVANINYDKDKKWTDNDLQYIEPKNKEAE